MQNYHVFIHCDTFLPSCPYFLSTISPPHVSYPHNVRTAPHNCALFRGSPFASIYVCHQRFLNVLLKWQYVKYCYLRIESFAHVPNRRPIQMRSSS